MVQKNMVCEGLSCYVRSKSAFIDWCMESSKESRGMLIQAMMEADRREGFFESSQMGSVVKMQIRWTKNKKSMCLMPLSGKSCGGASRRKCPRDWQLQWDLR